MAASERDVTREFDDLKADVKSMIDHVSKLTEQLGGSASQTAANVSEQLGNAAAAAGALGERARDKIEHSGKIRAEALGGYIQQYPITSVAVAFGLGLLAAKLLNGAAA